MEKHDFEIWDEFTLKTFLALLDYQNFNAGTEMTVFETQNSSEKNFDCDLGGRNHVCSQ